MNELVYPRERTLGVITLVLGLLFRFFLIVGTFGMALLFLAVGFIIYLFAQSALIAHIKGNGVELSERQFPELYAQFAECCARLQIRTLPQAYILNGNGGLNAFATKFLGDQFVVCCIQMSSMRWTSIKTGCASTSGTSWAICA